MGTRSHSAARPQICTEGLTAHDQTAGLHHPANPGVCPRHHCRGLRLPPISPFGRSLTGWAMFPITVSALMVGSIIVLYDGHPAYPDSSLLWAMAERYGMTCFGASPTYVTLVAKSGLSPGARYDLSELEGILMSGSSSPPELFTWFYEHVKPDLWVTSQSGGTDICSGFVGGIPTLPVHAGEIQGRLLGVDAQAFDDDGQSVVEQVGELVITKPMPSMPVFFWGDVENRRYIESYFETFPGVWRHGDYLKITARGTCGIYGRSDSTLNRNGVRIGTSEVYRAVESLDEVQDSLIVNLELPHGRFFMPLFVLLKPGSVLDDGLRQKICDKLRASCSPRHVPEKIYQVDAVRYTLTGKKMEVPVRRILMGVPAEKVANRGATANPDAIDFFVRLRAEQADFN